MNWIFISLFFVFFSWFAKDNWKKYVELAIPLSLLIWLMNQVDLLNLGTGEERLLQWFGTALVFLIVEKTMHAFLAFPLTWSYILISLAAFSFAMGFDVFRPDDYAIIPAGIMAILVLMVLIRAGLLLLNNKHSKENATFIIFQLAINALMLYASFYKLMDRSWALPWSYLVAAGTILFFLSQLWKIWESLNKPIEDWSDRISFSFSMAQFLVVVGAYFHYAQFI